MPHKLNWEIGSFQLGANVVTPVCSGFQASISLRLHKESITGRHPNLPDNCLDPCSLHLGGKRGTIFLIPVHLPVPRLASGYSCFFFSSGETSLVQTERILQYGCHGKQAPG